MINHNSSLIKGFLSEAIELNRHFLQLKISSEAEKLLPFERAIRSLRSGCDIPENLPELVTRIRHITRLKNELRATQQLATAIEQGYSGNIA